MVRPPRNPRRDRTTRCWTRRHLHQNVTGLLCPWCHGITRDQCPRRSLLWRHGCGRERRGAYPPPRCVCTVHRFGCWNGAPAPRVNHDDGKHPTAALPGFAPARKDEPPDLQLGGAAA